jgi:diguanylate cyclase (GGDEF)-like protein
MDLGKKSGRLPQPDRAPRRSDPVDSNRTRLAAAIVGSAAAGVAAFAAATRTVVRSRRRIDELEWLLASAASAPASRLEHTSAPAPLSEPEPAAVPSAAVARVQGPRDDLVDPETGLLDARYFHVALDQRVAAARRKLQPLAVMLVDVDVKAESALDFVQQAGVIHETLREADTICRIGTNRLGLILEEATEFGAVFAIERIRMSVNRAGGDEEHLWAGVAGYPSHALDAPQLLERAETALERARNSGKGWVRVARSETTETSETTD